jgi:hypothetical protein
MGDVDRETMQSVAEQLLSDSAIHLDERTLRIRKTSRHRLKTALFEMDGRQYEAIEQNPEKPSRWGKLAADGHKVVQFRDVETKKYVGVAVDGKVKVYGRGNIPGARLDSSALPRVPPEGV